MKKLKIITLSLALLLGVSQTQATMPTWLNKVFGFIKAKPKTSLVIGSAVAAIIGIIAFFG